MYKSPPLIIFANQAWEMLYTINDPPKIPHFWFLITFSHKYMTDLPKVLTQVPI